METTPELEASNYSIGAKEIINEIEQLKDKKEASTLISKNLQKVLSTQQKLAELVASEIRFSSPVLIQGENPVIFPNTINVIQGQAGVHKSRLAEVICSAFLKLNGNQNELLGFKRVNFDNIHTVVYVDTERNLLEQFPFAMQSIQIKAGYNRKDRPSNFQFLSLLEIPRSQRFDTLNEYLNLVTENTKNPLFIVLDVSTDCIEDFNKADKSMELIDLMNITVNHHNVIFLCIIHENPKSEKARGHFGTELMNKASTVIQVSFEKDANLNDTDLIRVKYLKCRSTAKHFPFYIKYKKESNGLVLADDLEVSNLKNSRKQKANLDEVVEIIVMHLGEGIELSRKDLIDKICEELSISTRTVENRLTEILKLEIDIFNGIGQSCKLVKKSNMKTMFYKLVPNELL